MTTFTKFGVKWGKTVAGGVGRRWAEEERKLTGERWILGVKGARWWIEN